MKRVEEQKRMRDEILRKKAEKRMGTGDESPIKNSSSRELPVKGNSIHINPAFKGGISVLEQNIRKAVSSGAVSEPSSAQPKTAQSGSLAKQPNSTTTSKEQPKKPKTILRVTRNKKGEIVHME